MAEIAPPAPSPPVGEAAASRRIAESYVAIGAQSFALSPGGWIPTHHILRRRPEPGCRVGDTNCSWTFWIWAYDSPERVCDVDAYTAAVRCVRWGSAHNDFVRRDVTREGGHAH